MTYTPKHTTDEYLAWIDKEVTETDILISTNWSMFLSTGDKKFAKETRKGQRYRASLLANRDVLERHEGEMLPTGSYPYESSDQYESHQCNCCRVDFPCPTYLDIAQRLDEVM